MVINYSYRGFNIVIEHNGLVDWGYIIEGMPYSRDNWDYVSSVLALSAAQSEIDVICNARKMIR